MKHANPWRCRLALYVLASATAAMAQVPEPLPDLHLTINGSVAALARQADGSVVIGGDFTLVDGQPRARLARLRPDGSLDPDWRPAVAGGGSGGVTALAVEPGSGAVYVGGIFDTVDGEYHRGLAKLTVAGAVDPAFNATANGPVLALALDGVGALYAGGAFSVIGSEPRAQLAKLAAASGALDPDWKPANDGIVFALVVDTAGQNVYVGGQFSSIGGQARTGLARLAAGGSGDADATWDPGSDQSVYALLGAADGAIYVGGAFTTLGGQPRSGLARLSNSGVLDAVWAPPGNVARALALSGTALYVGGYFDPGNGAPTRQMYKLSTDGAGVPDPDWNPPSSNSTVQTLAASADGTLQVGGGFSAIGEQACFGLARIAADGTLAGVVDVESPGVVKALTRQSDGGLLVGGAFRRANGAPRANLLRVTAAGTLDAQWRADADDAVAALALAPSGAIYAGGAFTRIGDQIRYHVARLDAGGHVDPDWAPWLNGTVLALATDAEGVYVGGYISQVDGTPRNGIARLALQGSGALDAQWDPAIAGFGYVSAIAPDGLGAVYVGGGFDAIGGQARVNLAKLASDGTGLADAEWQADTDGQVSAFILDGDALYVGGQFQTVAGVARGAVVRLRADATPDAWNPDIGGGYVSALAIDAAGSLYVGGAFYTAGGTPRTHLAKVLHDGSVDADWAPEPDGWINALAVAGNRLDVGGQFTWIDATPRNGYARFLDAALDPVFANGFESR